MNLIVKTVFVGVFGLIAGGVHAQEFSEDDLAALGFNHETQVSAACAEEFGVSYAAAGCIVSELTAEELSKCFEDGVGGEGCFGDNNTLVRIVAANIEAAAREDGDINQAIRATTGVSVRDIEDEGILGGENSEARKACNAIAGIFGGGC
jgi:hypothetical protein